ncbi:mitotic spindle assembly checkpoint protein MAD2B-like [Xenia sp. Carnegie-2017]|uniref:mitotic spindle assembly checkpoint protein MAD2B-like n=1 Tax=Xenia sp. Carnegie-2017 TaxID=2897299 RepID=UPI001F034833|nr:mitotic spindle assembly checkpoint protein MAD2B-like [Xenia sp. Carnegie-2017]XP_046854216.1 mitotic spindle assembly checkpoint protein MAD2B-like [Xenia sp. Carnegie-2017]
MEAREAEGFDANGRNDASDILCEFLEVAVHFILYMREVYPAGIFEKRMKYNVAVQMSCHPELNQYIQNVLYSIKPCLEKGEVEKFAVAIIDKELHPLERFVFEIKSGYDFVSLRKEDPCFFKIESTLRAFLLKIGVCDAMLQPNPSDCRFSIMVYTKQSSEMKIEESDDTQAFAWINVEKNEAEMESPWIIPLKSNSSQFFKMQLFVEESRTKDT